ncbi:MAG: hypothetical protein OXT05_12550 [Chloroflexota bacterium]|nr:hypothetical protein [Chloroflexota bacterium]
MDKPGLARAIPALIIGFIASLAFVYAMRALQNMEPVWMNADSSEGAQVGMVLAAFICMAAFMWGVGAFNPKMSEHGEHADEHEEEAPEKDFTLRTGGLVFRAGKWLWDLTWSIINDSPKPWVFPYLNVSFFLINWIVNVIWFLVWFLVGFLAWRVFLMLLAGIPGTLGALLMSVSCLWQTMAFYAGQLFLVLTIAVITTVLLFTFALLPHGLSLQVATEPNADFFANGFGDFVIPIQDILGLLLPPDDFANQTIEGTSQFTVLLGFILIIFVSLALAAGGIAVFFYLAHRGVREVKELEPTDGERTQILPIREAGKIAGGVVGVIRAIPRAIGYQK